jgi:hypothetical protein
MKHLTQLLDLPLQLWKLMILLVVMQLLLLQLLLL